LVVCGGGVVGSDVFLLLVFNFHGLRLPLLLAAKTAVTFTHGTTE
jgi:hypothetical protein